MDHRVSCGERLHVQNSHMSIYNVKESIVRVTHLYRTDCI